MTVEALTCLKSQLMPGFQLIKFQSCYSNAGLGKTPTRYNIYSRIPQAPTHVCLVISAAQEKPAPLDCLESIKLWVP